MSFKSSRPLNEKCEKFDSQSHLLTQWETLAKTVTAMFFNLPTAHRTTHQGFCCLAHHVPVCATLVLLGVCFVCA